MRPLEELIGYVACFIQRGFTKRAGARNRDGDVCSTIDPTASRWCLWGAVDAATQSHQLSLREADLVWRTINQHTSGAVSWNDRWWRTKGSVLRMLRRAAKNPYRRSYPLPEPQ